jgi:Uma2 family endonuclease
VPDSPTVRDSSRLESDDGVYYPSSDKMGESGLQNSTARLLVDLLADYLRRHAHPAVVGNNQFFYYKRGDPHAAVSPDLYIIDGETLEQADIPSWKVWEHAGKVPTLALEIVSDEYRKDYADILIERYEQLGVRELIRYDPLFTRSRTRKRFSQFIRDDRGRLVPQPEPIDRVRSAFYDLWFVRQPNNTLRIATGPNGDILWPTHAERAAAEAERAAAAAERAAAEAERAAAEAEARAAEARARIAAEARADEAEAELTRLRAELARLRSA